MIDDDFFSELASDGIGAPRLGMPMPKKGIVPNGNGTKSGADYLSAAEKARYRKQVIKEERARIKKRCLESFAYFSKRAWKYIAKQELIWSWHLDTLCNHLQALGEELIKARKDHSYEMRWHKLIINVPPRSGKSQFTSVLFPVWLWLHDPSLDFLCMSGQDDLVKRDSNVTRELLESKWFRRTFDIKWSFDPKVDSVHKYANTEGGKRYSKPWKAGVTGLGADVLLYDDPHDAKKAESEAERSAVTEKYDISISSRKEDPKRYLEILIMQRLHELDLAGHLLAKEGGDWHHLCLPMVYEGRHKYIHTKDNPTFLGFVDPRSDGDILQPNRFDQKHLADQRTALGSMGYAGQMQQLPAPMEGGFFKKAWWRFFRFEGQGNPRPRPHGCIEEPPRVIKSWKDFDTALISVDCAFKKTETSDYVGIVAIGTKGPDRFIFGNWTARLSAKETAERVLEIRRMYPNCSRVLVEDAANGQAVVEYLSTSISGVIVVKPEGGKESRAFATCPQVEAGNVYLLDGASWLEDYVNELGTFPNAAHDDQVDATTQGLNYLSDTLDVARAKMLCGVGIYR